MAIRRLVLLLVGMALAVSGFAQGALVGAYGRTILASMPDVQKELKLSKDQNKKIQDAIKQIEEKMRAGEINFDFANPLSGVDEQLATILDEAQQKRLEELYLQANAGFALADKKVSTWLELSEEQRKTVQSRQQSASRELMGKVMSPGGGPPDMKAIQSRKKELAEGMLDVLSEVQRKKFEEGKGKAFKFKTVV